MKANYTSVQSLFLPANRPRALEKVTSECSRFPSYTNEITTTLRTRLGMDCVCHGLRAVLVLFPEIDLAVSRLFYTPGVGFEANGTKLERLTHGSVGFLLVLGNIALVALLLFGRFANRLRIRFTAKELALLLLLLALGPGLIVNTLLKENWGRARPVDVSELGGSKTFSTAFVPSDQESKSFSSGHTATSAYWIVVVLL